MHTISLQELFGIKNPRTSVVVKIILWTLLLLCIAITSTLAMIEIMDNCPTYANTTWSLDEDDCVGDGPMLLSRAITTATTVRGLAISMSLLGALLVDTPALKGDDHSPIHNVLKYAFFCIAIAFTVSMFDAHRTHSILIITGAVVALLATYPRGERTKETLFCPCCFTKTWWWALWITTVVSAVVWIYGYIQTSLPENQPSLRSYWYVAEYVFFALLLETVAFVNIYLELRDYAGREFRNLDEK